MMFVAVVAVGSGTMASGAAVSRRAVRRVSAKPNAATLSTTTSVSSMTATVIWSGSNGAISAMATA